MSTTNTDTVSKLSDALTQLIAGYEKLQKQNDDLTEQNEALQNELDELKNEKLSLEDNYQELNESTEKQETNINSMLGKIESLLGVSKSSKKELQDIVVDEPVVSQEEKEKNEAQEIEESIFNTPSQHETSDVSDLQLNNNTQNDTYKEEEKLDLGIPTQNNDTKKEEEDNKLDLNRMASLLNGFNK